MRRRISFSVVALGLLLAGLGCRSSCGSSCGERQGLFHHSGGSTTGVPTSYGKAGADCYMGEPVPGQLMSFPGAAGVPVPPGPGVAPVYPNELPMPQPSELIPGQRVPFAPTAPAPAPDASFSSSKGK